MKKWVKKLGSSIFTGFMHIVFFLFGIGVRILYCGHVVYTDPTAKAAMQQGAILIANHQSHKDGFFVPQMLFHKKIHVLVTSKWYHKKILNPMFRHLRYIPIDLQQQDSTWIGQTEAILKKGQCVLIFPEGKLETNGIPEPFHSGFLLPVKHLNVPVIPMAIVGKYRIFHKQTLVIGSPLNLDLHKKGRLSAILSEASEQCKTAVFTLANRE